MFHLLKTLKHSRYQGVVTLRSVVAISSLVILPLLVGSPRGFITSSVKSDTQVSVQEQMAVASLVKTEESLTADHLDAHLDELIEDLSSESPERVRKAEKELSSKGEEAMEPLLEALKEHYAPAHIHANLNLSAPVKPVEIMVIAEAKEKEPDIKQLMAGLRKCKPGAHCAVIEKLVETQEEAQDALIQALLDPNEHTRSLAKIILAKRAATKADTPLFQNYHYSKSPPKELAAEEPVFTKLNQSGEDTASQDSFLTGTRWKGTDSAGEELSMEFKDGGKFIYTTGTGTFDNAAWEQIESTLTISINNGFAKYWGVVDGDTMFGRAQNENGDKWSWEFERQ